MFKSRKTILALVFAAGLFLPAVSLAKSGDAIGIKILKNPARLSPVAWYLQNVPNPGKPEVIDVDGYPAIKDGRTVYVAATNLVGQLYADVYLISYNEGADASTISIFNQFLKTWKFNVNVGTSVGDIADRDKMKRDMRRINDLNDILAGLENYKTLHGTYPKLESGTYKKGLTFSVWPSWQATLGTALGSALPIDPINKFDGCADPFDKATCWNEKTVQFMCPAEARVYAYQSNQEGTEIKLYTNFEYAGAGTWRTGKFGEILTGQCFSFLQAQTADIDGDTIPNDKDNCPTTYNLNQSDSDADRIGDSCDKCINDPSNDIDNDGVCGNIDNCPTVNNPDQKNTLKNKPTDDGRGDACRKQSCGNGRREGAEECDGLSGVAAHQKCAVDCKLVDLTYCGDGRVQSPDDEGVAEDCEPGDKLRLSCTYKSGNLTYDGFQNRVCSNSCKWVNSGACQPNCNCPSYSPTNGTCRGGVVPGGDGLCADTPDGNGLCVDGSSCRQAQCGNGIVEGKTVNGVRYGEDCDGNTDIKDCRNVLYGEGTCEKPGVQCYGAAQLRVCKADCSWSNYSFCSVTQFCGDGVINGPEDHSYDPNETQSSWLTRTLGWRTYDDVQSQLKKISSGMSIVDPRKVGDGCDYGNMNGVINCSNQYDASGNTTNVGGCSYCSNQCAIKKLTGAYCGDGIIQNTEQCDCPPGDVKCQVGTGVDRSHQYSCTKGAWSAGGCRQTGGYMGNAIIDTNFGEECDCGTAGKVACLPDEQAGTNGCVVVPLICDVGIGVDRGLNRCNAGKLELIEDCSYITQ